VGLEERVSLGGEPLFLARVEGVKTIRSSHCFRKERAGRGGGVTKSKERNGHRRKAREGRLHTEPGQGSKDSKGAFRNLPQFGFWFTRGKRHQIATRHMTELRNSSVVFVKETVEGDNQYLIEPARRLLLLVNFLQGDRSRSGECRKQLAERAKKAVSFFRKGAKWGVYGIKTGHMFERVFGTKDSRTKRDRARSTEGLAFGQDVRTKRLAHNAVRI